jgi:hypothetical protein
MRRNNEEKSSNEMKLRNAALLPLRGTLRVAAEAGDHESF